MKPLISTPAVASLILACAVAPTPARAQTPDGPGEWGEERALELIRTAQQRRSEAVRDTGLVNYRARALGRVYFYLDREDTGERNLVKTDQLALDVLWEAPDRVKQRIVGWRDERALPTNIHYHIDHLSVVQENFGNEIRIGDGDEVRGVVHPAAPLAERFYEYRLSDSLTLSLPGAAEPVRVYRLDVRPRDPSVPAFIGAVFVERRLGDIVRMDFTFSASAYVDPYLDYINISLDNGLWGGRHWLPNEQRVELRRRIPHLDIPAGSVIRANMRLQEYAFNEPLPPGTFEGPPVVALPRAQREAFPFEEPIDAELREEGLGPTAELAEIRAEARRLVRERALSRVSGVRPAAERVSDVLRYNRAEGLAVGAGLSYRPSPGVRMSALAGYAFGEEQPYGRLGARIGAGTVLGAQAYLNRVTDTGIAPAASGLMNSLSALLAGRDYLDPYYASGASLDLSRRVGLGWTAAGEMGVAWYESASLEVERSLFGRRLRGVESVRAADPVALAAVWLERERPAEQGAGIGARLSVEAGRGLGDAGDAWVAPRAEMGIIRRWRPADASLEVDAAGGAVFGTRLPQDEYRLGGRGTLPGFAFRSFAGRRFATAGVVASADVLAPWLRGRVRADVGWAGSGSSLAGTGAPKASIGAGVGILYDILRVDLVRGLGPLGRWELVVDAHPSFWDFL